MPPRGNTRVIRLLVNLFMARFSPSDIDRVARTPLRVGVAGDGDLIDEFRRLLTLDRVPSDVPFPSLSLHALPAEDPGNHWHILDDCQFVIVLLRREDLMGDVIYRVKEALPKKVGSIWAAVGQIEPWLRYEIGEIAADLKIQSFVFIDELSAEAARPLLKEMVKGLGGYDISAARKMPLLRDLVASRVIARSARQNLMIAMASALPNTLPWVGPIVGLLGVTAEIIFLTSNQLRMVLQIASIYDQEMNVSERLKELLPVIGGAFGWRALSRELVGFVPAIGPAVKGAIAFAATRATGEAARWFYKTGTHMDPEERRRIYNEALEKAESLTRRVGQILPSLGPDERQALIEEEAAPLPSPSPLIETLEAPPPPVGEEDEPVDKPHGEELPKALAEVAPTPPPSTQEPEASPAEPSPRPQNEGRRTRAPRPKIDIERNTRRRSDAPGKEKKDT
jgi:uncharacterized protein (DUF697 family)